MSIEDLRNTHYVNHHYPTTSQEGSTKARTRLFHFAAHLNGREVEGYGEVGILDADLVGRGEVMAYLMLQAMVLLPILLICILMLIPTVPVIIGLSIKKEISLKSISIYTILVYGCLFYTGITKPPETMEFVYLLILIPVIHITLYTLSLRYIKRDRTFIYASTALASALLSAILFFSFMFSYYR